MAKLQAALSPACAHRTRWLTGGTAQKRWRWMGRGVCPAQGWGCRLRRRSEDRMRVHAAHAKRACAWGMEESVSSEVRAVY